MALRGGAAGEERGERWHRDGCPRGRAGLGTYSPPLDDQGNSVRGRMLTTQIAEALGLHIFASDVHPDVGAPS